MSDMKVSVLISAVDRMTKPMQRMIGKVNAFGRAARHVANSPAFQRMTRSFKRVGRSIKGMYHGLGRVLGRVSLLGAAATAAGVAMIHGYVSGTAELGRFARQVGVNVGALDKW